MRSLVIQVVCSKVLAGGLVTLPEFVESMLLLIPVPLHLLELYCTIFVTLPPFPSASVSSTFDPLQYCGARAVPSGGLTVPPQFVAFACIVERRVLPEPSAYIPIKL